MKTCGDCGESKELTGFYRDSSRRDGYEPRCKPCATALRKARKLGTTAGMPRYRYDALLLAQNNKCAICSQPPAAGKSLFIDHMHGGSTRGLLCNRCNAGLGHFLDQAALLRAAADYIERHANG